MDQTFYGFLLSSLSRGLDSSFLVFYLRVSEPPKFYSNLVGTDHRYVASLLTRFAICRASIDLKDSSQKNKPLSGAYYGKAPYFFAQRETLFYTLIF